MTHDLAVDTHRLMTARWTEWILADEGLSGDPPPGVAASVARVEAYAAVVLAGGRAGRLGGVAKPGVRIGGRTLLDRVLDAVADAAPRIVVGPDQAVPAGVRVTREQPAGGGPVAALAAGLALVPDGTAWVAVLAADLPFLTPDAVAALGLAAAGRDGAVLVDDGGRAQYLAGVWRVGALVAALNGLGEPAGASVRRLLAGLDMAEVAVGGDPPPWFDCDDADDVRRAHAWTTEEERT